MVQQQIIRVRGASGTTYPLTLYPWGTPFQRFGAVYLVLRQLENSNYRILYVGETADMGERFDDHHKEPCFRRNGRSHIGVLSEEPPKPRRLAIEQDLITAYGTPCNG